MVKKKVKKDLIGYYYDGKKSWKMYKDENGKEWQEEWNKSESNYDYSGVDHDKLLHDRFYK